MKHFKGRVDCPSGADEENCRTPPLRTTCRENEFRCGSASSASSAPRPSRFSGASCIPQSWVCDGHADCEDRSDESNSCPQRTCGPLSFQCANGRCIPLLWKCGKFKLRFNIQ